MPDGAAPDEGDDMPVKTRTSAELPDAPWQMFMNTGCIARELGVSRERFRQVSIEAMKGGDSFPHPAGYVETQGRNPHMPIWRADQLPDIVKWWEKRKKGTGKRDEQRERGE